MTDTLPPCPQCESEYTYLDQGQFVCSMCAFEWRAEDLIDDDEIKVKDANGALLSDGDKVIVIKDLKIKGSSQVIKIGTKALVRRVLDKKDHELDCKVDGIGEMMVTAKFIKKA